MLVRTCEEYAIVVRLRDPKDDAAAIYEALQHAVGVLTYIAGVREVYIDTKYAEPIEEDFDYTGPVLEG